MIELKNSNEPDNSLNDQLMNLSGLLHLNWRFGRQPGGSIISSQGDKSCIPFVAKKALLTKSDIQAAFVKSTDNLIKATSEIHVIRDSTVVRIIPVAFSGERQLNPPHISAGIYANPAAGDPGFPRQAGQYFEFAAAYTDNTGRTHPSDIVKVRTDLNSTVVQHLNHVFIASSSINSSVHPTNSTVIDTAWMSKGDIITSNDFPAFMVAPYDQVSGKETVTLEIPSNTVGALSGLVGDYLLNHKPTMYGSGTSSSWSTNCEVCFGVVTPDGANIVRTSDIVTITAAGSKQFYPDAISSVGNGWSMSEDQQNPVMVGVDQLLKHPIYTKTYLKVKAMLLWRPAGETKWSKSTSFTANSAPTASYYHIPHQNTFIGEYDEMGTLPQVNRVAALKVGISVNSESLGVVGDGPSAARVYRVSADGNTYLLNPKPTVMNGYVSYERNYKTDHGSNHSKYDLGNVPVVNGHLPCGVVIFSKTPNLTDDMKHPRKSPTGDTFFNQGERVRIDLSVHLRADATGAEWYVRSVTRNVSGSESRGSWGRMSGSGFNNQYSTSVAANATLPNANTTAVRPGNHNGLLDWNNPLADEFVILPGDQIVLNGFTYVAGSGRKGDHLSGYGNTTAYQSFDIAIPIKLLE